METINIKRIWEIFQIVDRIDEDGTLDFNNTFLEYEGFLDWFSFKMLKDTIMVYNNGRVPYEDDTWNDFNYIPFSVMKMTDREVEKWEQKRKETLLEEIERNKEVLERDFGMKFE